MKRTGIDLHRHLEGSIRPATLLELAREFRIPRISDDPAVFAADFVVRPGPACTFGSFLLRFDWMRPFWVHREAIERAAAQAVKDAAAEGIGRLELRFSPVYFSMARGFDPARVAEWIIAAARSASPRGMQIRFLGTVARHLPPRLNEPTIDLALQSDDFSGLDLAGDERAPGTAYAAAFRRALEIGRTVTVHAGEQRGTGSNIPAAIDQFGARRLGHATEAWVDPTLLERIRGSGAVVELCPSSTVATGRLRRIEEHPASGCARIQVVVGTDDPAVFETTVDRELKLARSIGFDIASARRTALQLWDRGA